MGSQARIKKILAELGSPQSINRDLQDFSRSARILSSTHPRLIEKYPQQWVAVYRGRVRASADTLESVLSQIDKKGLPRGQTIVRFINKNPRTMIL